MASGKVFWVPPGQGGRADLPKGLQYSTVSKWPEDSPGSAWSVVLEFDRSPAEQGSPTPARIRFLVDDAPDRLKPGRTFEIYEGRRKVADVQVEG